MLAQLLSQFTVIVDLAVEDGVNPGWMRERLISARYPLNCKSVITECPTRSYVIALTIWTAS